MKIKSIVILLIFVIAAVLYIACVKSPVSSNEEQTETELISIFREDWTLSSKPVGLDQANPRGKLIWYNPYTMIATDEIWDRELARGETGTHTIWMEFTPSDTGTVSGSWAGIMQYVRITQLREDTAQYLELRMYGSSGIIHIDMGSISEDVNGNGLLDTEDKPDPYSLIPNGIIDSGEDVGLDGIVDNNEPGYDPATNPDPNGDNWWYNGSGIRCADCTDDPYDYRYINGTEGNELDPGKLGRPDTEDLDREGDSDRQNSYVSYKIDLENSGFLLSGSDYNGWNTYRIPLNDSLLADTIINPGDFPFPIGSRLLYVRLWFESQNDEPFKIGIASVDFVGFKEPGEKGFIAKEVNIRDFQYAYGRLFDLGRMASNHDEPSEFDFVPGDTIKNIQLFKRAIIGATTDTASPSADFYVDLDDTLNYEMEKSHTHVSEIDPSEYYIHPYEHWILFNSVNGGSDGILGYFMIVKRANGDTDTLGQIIEEPFKLKLIKHNDPMSNFITWNYEWRNVYDLRQRNIDLEGWGINIYKGGPGTETSGENIDHQEGIKYIQILGLDRFDRNGASAPDGLTDINSAIIDPYRGLLLFPERKPFASDYEFIEGVVLDPQIPEIYDFPYGHKESLQTSRYYIKINYIIYDYLK